MTDTKLRAVRRRFTLGLTQFFFSYRNVPTQSLLWHRRGQLLIVVSTLLIIMSWANFIATPLLAFGVTRPLLAAGLTMSGTSYAS
jgi:hypothetical protein